MATFAEETALMNDAVDQVEALEAVIKRYRSALKEIAYKGHHDKHGAGYTLATIAQEALASIWGET